MTSRIYEHNADVCNFPGMSGNYAHAHAIFTRRYFSLDQRLGTRLMYNMHVCMYMYMYIHCTCICTCTQYIVAEREGRERERGSEREKEGEEGREGGVRREKLKRSGWSKDGGTEEEKEGESEKGRKALKCKREKRRLRRR